MRLHVGKVVTCTLVHVLELRQMGDFLRVTEDRNLTQHLP